MWILSKMIFWKCEFCHKSNFQNVNFVKNDILKIWILRSVRFWKCEFCENEISKMWILSKIKLSKNWKFQILQNFGRFTGPNWFYFRKLNFFKRCIADWCEVQKSSWPLKDTPFDCTAVRKGRGVAKTFTNYNHQRPTERQQAGTEKFSVDRLKMH